MAITLEMEPEEEARLRRRAERQGTTAERLASELLRRGLSDNGEHAAPDAEEPDLVEYWRGFIGVVEGSGEPAARNVGSLFTDHLAEKKRQGTL